MTQGTLRQITDELIEQVRARIVAASDPELVILFGSAARNEAQAGSDLDLLVVVDQPEGVTALDKARELHAQFFGWRLPIDIVVLSPSEWSRGLQLPGHIARIASREGIRLYG